MRIITFINHETLMNRLLDFEMLCDLTWLGMELPARTPPDAISHPHLRELCANGVYLFGVTAYPVGDTTDGLFLGYGRISLRSYAE